MYYDFIQRNKKLLQLIGVGLFILIVAWALATYITRSGKVAVVVRVVPSSATISVNNTNIGNGTHYLKPGQYTFTATKDGFEQQKITTTITSDKDQNVVALSLVPKSDEAQKWADSHQDEYKKNETYGAIQASNDGKYFTDKNPITTKLPFTDPYFTIGYTPNPDNTITLTVSTPSPRYRFYAVEQIRKMGYDPTDFKIVFKDFNNPLGETIKNEAENETK